MTLNTPLSTIQETIERSIFHSIRKQCVHRGFLPDIETFPDTPAGYIQYRKAFEPINQDMGFSIEVFQSGAPADRVSKQVPRIVLSTQGFIPGSIGGDESHQYKLEKDNYYAYIAPPTTSDLFINIHIVSNNIVQHRLLSAIMALAVPRRGYVKAYPNEDFNFFIKHLSYVPVRQANLPGVMETIYRYVCPDLFEVEEIVVNTNISPLKEIDLKIGDGDNYIID